MGRPPILGDNGTITATFRLSPDQDEAIRKASKQAGKQRSEWMREVLLDAAKAA